MRQRRVFSAAAVLALQGGSALAQNQPPLGFFVTSVGSGLFCCFAAK